MNMISEEIKGKVLGGLLSGQTLDQVTKRYHVSRHTILRWMPRIEGELSIVDIDFPDASDKLEDRVCEQYHRGRSIAQIAYAVRKSELLVKQILKLNGYEEFKDIYVPALYEHCDLTKLI
jgi:hypothetical protein